MNAGRAGTLGAMLTSIVVACSTSGPLPPSEPPPSQREVAPGPTEGRMAGIAERLPSSPEPGYGTRVAAAVRKNIAITKEMGQSPGLRANPVAEVEVRTAYDGRIVALKLTKSSGVPPWDAAVLRALEKTERLPLDHQGRIPPVMVLAFRPH